MNNESVDGGDGVNPTVLHEIESGKQTTYNEHQQQTKRFRILKKTDSIVFMLILIGCFFILEIVVGHVTKSTALIADSFHMLSDVISLVIALVAVKMSDKASTRNTFGWVRAEVYGSLVNSVFLLALCVSIVLQALDRFLEPEAVRDVNKVIIVGAIGLFINLIGLVVFGMHGHQHGHSHGGNRDLNIFSVFLHCLSDALSELAVIVSGLIIKYVPPYGLQTGWKLYIDPTLSLLITILIVSSTVPLLKKASLILLQTIPSHVDVIELKKQICAITGVLDIHCFHLWSLNPEKLVATAHLKIQRQIVADEFKIIDEVKNLLHDYGIHASTLQLEYDDDKPSGYSYDCCKDLKCRKKQCCVVDEKK